jgi:hypothetical protein
LLVEKVEKGLLEADLLKKLVKVGITSNCVCIWCRPLKGALDAGAEVLQMEEPRRRILQEDPCGGANSLDNIFARLKSVRALVLQQSEQHT